MVCIWGEAGDETSSVLLPKKQVPEGTKLGDTLQVFIYKDSEDRLIATTGTPKLEVGQVAVLQVKDVAKGGGVFGHGSGEGFTAPF